MKFIAREVCSWFMEESKLIIQPNQLLAGVWQNKTQVTDCLKITFTRLIYLVHLSSLLQPVKKYLQMGGGK